MLGASPNKIATETNAGFKRLQSMVHVLSPDAAISQDARVAGLRALVNDKSCWQQEAFSMDTPFFPAELKAKVFGSIESSSTQMDWLKMAFVRHVEGKPYDKVEPARQWEIVKNAPKEYLGIMSAFAFTADGYKAADSIDVPLIHILSSRKHQTLDEVTHIFTELSKLEKYEAIAVLAKGNPAIKYDAVELLLKNYSADSNNPQDRSRLIEKAMEVLLYTRTENKSSFSEVELLNLTTIKAAIAADRYFDLIDGFNPNNPDPAPAPKKVQDSLISAIIHWRDNHYDTRIYISALRLVTTPDALPDSVMTPEFKALFADTYAKSPTRLVDGNIFDKLAGIGANPPQVASQQR
jgi:hypothetical protein